MEACPPYDNNEHHANRRGREVYRYFHPMPSPLAPSGPPATSYFDSWMSNNAVLTEDATHPGLSKNAPSLSTMPVPTAGSCGSSFPPVQPDELVLGGNSNRTLNAFAQLAALKLNVQRVLISVSDRQSQFIVANSTQTTSLDPNGGNGEDDSLWAKCAVEDQAWSMCKVCVLKPLVFCINSFPMANRMGLKATIDLPPSSRNPPQYRFLTVDDLSKDDRYKSLPFVQGDPHFRFYAGTPLTSKTNINIGCFFALDSNPREGLTPEEKETMGSLGMLIMDYLDVSRQAHEGQRATRLSRGLSCFVEGASSFADQTHSSYFITPDMSSTSSDANNSRPTHLAVDPDSCDAQSFNSGSSKADPGSSLSSSLHFPGLWSNARRKESPVEETQDPLWPFKRAANLLREGLQVGDEGGVIFLEAGPNPGLDLESGSDSSAGESANPATVLAVSTLDEPFASDSDCTGSKVRYPAMNLDRSFLLRLFRRYSRGRLWGFHRDGMLSSSEDEDADEKQAATINKKPAGKGKWKAMENKLLNTYFPNATQVLFVPLWNAANGQWFAGCFCWNSVETNVFSPTVELSSVFGFGSSIMAEHSRIQSLIADRQKGDFIGSISHELRSPLHGILAAVEFLQGTPVDEFQGSLLDTVNACGRTLLDTMNQVLDFSKIVSLERTWRSIKRSSRSSPLELKNTDRPHLDAYVTADVAVLAEEVVEGVCLGHAFGQRATASSEHPVLLPHTTAREDNRNDDDKTDPNKCTDVEVVMDVTHNDWVYHTQPGALRRILMNILGNAMKYTKFGRISVHLEVSESRQGSKDLVTLTVSDTGRGISPEFMRARLYTPFTQEDSLAVGTGLGMSIVRSLAKALNGSVHTCSRLGEGTVVKVSLPLERPGYYSSSESAGDDAKDALSQSRLLQEEFGGRRVAILGVDPAKDVHQHSLWSVISRYLTEWYKLELVSWSPDMPVPIDLLLADEQMLMDSGMETSVNAPALLVLCNKSVDYGTARTEWSHLADVVEMIRQPSGPHKLARTIRKALENVPTAAPSPVEVPVRPKSQAITFSTTEVSCEGSPSPSLSPSGVKHIDLAGVNVEFTPELTSSSGASSSRSPGSESEPAEPFTTSAAPLSLSPSLENAEQVTVIDKTPRVLVVDDNSINLNLMMTFLKKRKLPVLHPAENGRIATDAVESIKGYDIIFLGMSSRCDTLLLV